jgi:hypothetical protein
VSLLFALIKFNRYRITEQPPKKTFVGNTVMPIRISTGMLAEI